MVNIVDNSFDYCQTNRELAKELSETRQKLTQAIDLIHQKDEELIKKGVENYDLKSLLTETMIIKEKYNAIVDIIMDRNAPESLQQEQQHQSRILALTSSCHNNSTTNFDHIDDGSEIIVRTDRQKSIDHNQRSYEEQSGELSFSRITERTEEDSCSSRDSLDPPEVTSVPPLVPERIIATPSIWKCLDSIHDSPVQNSPIQLLNKSKMGARDMLHSTPVRVQISGLQEKISSTNAQLEGDNQENVPSEQDNNTKKQRQPVKRKKRRQQQTQDTTDTTGEPETSAQLPRYNLRKRAKN